MKAKIVPILIFLFFCGCATVYNPATQREEFIFISTTQEVNMGENFAKQIEQQLDVSNNISFLERVNFIGQKVAAVSDRQDIDYHFGVINDQEVNAFALPGGYIYVNTGLLKMVNDDELAGVIGHEIGHVAAKHSVKAMQAALGYNLFMGIVFGGEKYHSVVQTTDILFNIVHLKYSREDEMLADKLAIKYAFLSEFSPNGMLSFLKKLKEKSEKQGEFEGILILRSHPYLEQRIEGVKKEIDLLYEKQ